MEHCPDHSRMIDAVDTLTRQSEVNAGLLSEIKEVVMDIRHTVFGNGDVGICEAQRDLRREVCAHGTKLDAIGTWLQTNSATIEAIRKTRDEARAAFISQIFKVLPWLFAVLMGGLMAANKWGT